MSLSLSRSSLIARRLSLNMVPRAMFSGGKDGEAGAVRGAGGSFAKREQAQEDQYFRKLQSQQLQNLKKHVDEEVAHHEAEIKRHQERIRQLKEKSKDLEK